MTLKEKMAEMKQDEARQAGAVATQVPSTPAQAVSVTSVVDEPAPEGQPVSEKTQVSADDANVQAGDTAQPDARLQSENEELRQENVRLKAANDYLDHRWKTFAGMHNKQVTSVSAENESLKQRVAVLEQQLSSVPRTSLVEETLKKRFGETWGNMDAETRDMWLKQEEAHQADIASLRSTAVSPKQAATNDRAEKLWAKVESLKAGFRAAMTDDLSGLPVFLDDQNPDSADGMTYKQCIEEAVKAGRVQEIVEIADKFTSLTGHKFDGEPTTRVVVPRPLVSMPASSASRQSGPTTTQTTTTDKPRFPKAWANVAHRTMLDMATDIRRGKRFRPLAIEVGKFKRSFRTVAEMHKLMQEIEDAEMDDRLD